MLLADLKLCYLNKSAGFCSVSLRPTSVFFIKIIYIFKNTKIYRKQSPDEQCTATYGGGAAPFYSGFHTARKTPVTFSSILSLKGEKNLNLKIVAKQNICCSVIGPDCEMSFMCFVTQSCVV